MTTAPLILRTAAAELGLAPQSGGCVTHYTHEGADVLLPWSSDLSAPATGFAAFPLFPFSGRIANGQFRFAGGEVQLPPNFPPEPHAIHGQAWQAEWVVAGHDATSAWLTYDHNGVGWPWIYRAEQSFNLTDDGLVVDLRLTNTSDSPMPAGLGWHPYFPLGDAEVKADVSAIWLSGDDMIPGPPSALSPENDLRTRRAVRDMRVDNCYAFETGDVQMVWPKRGLKISMTCSEPLRHLIVYTPPGEDYFCAEPVSHSPDAVNSSEPQSVTGLRVLSPGEDIHGTIHLDVNS